MSDWQSDLIFLFKIWWTEQVYADDWTTKSLPDLIAARQACVAKLNVPEETLVKYKAWNFTDDELTRSYITCVFKEFGLFCDHEGFHIDRLVLQFKSGDDDDIQSRIERCTNKTDADTTNELWVFRAFKCFTADNLALVKSRMTKANWTQMGSLILVGNKKKTKVQ